MLVIGCSFFEESTFFRGLENALCDYALDKLGVMRVLESLEEKHMALLQRLLPEIGQDVDVLVFSDDLGTQNAPMVTRTMCAESDPPLQNCLGLYAQP
jgi:hypothetical protein